MLTIDVGIFFYKIYLERRSIYDSYISKFWSEKGCISYRLQQNTEKENHLIFVEEWESNEAIEQHNASGHFTRIVPLLVKMCESAPIIQTFNKLV